MPTYQDLVKSLENEPLKRIALVLPHPLEEIFPDRPHDPIAKSQTDLLQKNYESLVAAAFSK